MAAQAPLVNAQEAPPPAEFSLAGQGFGEQVVRGGTATLDMYFPGTGRYRVGDDNLFTLVMSHADIMDPETSTVSVVFNGVPLKTWFLTSETARQREVPMPITANMLRPETNHVQLRFIMRLPGEACADVEHPALSATIFRQTSLRYDYLDGFPRRATEASDLGRFPLNLMEPSSIETSRLAIVLPDEANPTHLRAGMSLGAAVGRGAGGRAIDMRLLSARDAESALGEANVVIVGEPTANGLWSHPRFRDADLPLPLVDPTSGTFAREDGQTVQPGHGVLMDVASPWNPELRALLVSGATDEAVLNAALALSSSTARRTLHGTIAIVVERPEEPERGGVSAETLTDFSLADLGQSDRTVSGWGSHTLSYTFDSTGVPARGASARVIFDHSRVLNPNVSTMAVALNNIPLRDTALKTDGAGRSTLDVEFPPKVLRAGRNTLSVRFNLAPQPSGEGATCGSLPPELAWVVLYSDSTIHLPPGTAGGAGLGSFPFPFIREGRAVDTLLVLPDDLRQAEHAVQLAAEFGRALRTDVLDLPITTASRLDAEQRAQSNLVVFGTPGSNPLVEQLGPSLPLRLDGQGRIVQGATGALAGVQDETELGILQTIASPFNPQRAVLVVTATAAEHLGLAVRGLRQGGLEGNLATISRSPIPSPGGEPALQVRTFDVQLTQAERPATLQAETAVPNAVTVAVAGLVLLLLAASGFTLFRRVRAARARTDAEDSSYWEDWLQETENKP